jgi:S-disulfanyl-L-cysteine oxidoreductase SoxD
MSMRERVLLCFVALSMAKAAAAEIPNLGRVVTREDAAPYDISIGPDGAGLPEGGGVALRGKTIYEEKCLACHGEKGAGKPNDQLVGGVGTLNGDQPAVKTVGSFWPYATTLFDYVRRAMPFNAPKSLTNDETYAVTAYILHLNGVIGAADVVNARSLPTIAMPNRNGFTPYVARR